MSGFSFASAQRCLDRCSAGEIGHLLRYWLSLWREDRLPLRADFHPREVADLLPLIGIFDVVPDRSVRCRLVGSRLVEAAGGIDVTGRDWLELTAPEHRPVRLQRYSDVARGAVGHGIRTGRRLSGDLLSAEEIMLPFADVAADGTRQVLNYLAWTPSLYDPVLTGIANNSNLLSEFELIQLRA